MTDYKKDYLALAEEKENVTRFTHTKGVVKEAVALAKKYGVDENKAKIAAALHDITKNVPIEEQEEVIRKNFGEEYLIEFPIGAYHSLTGYVYARDILQIDDQDILNAIKNHTLGRPEMSLLEKIVFISDFIEPSRGSAEADTGKSLAYINLDQSLVYIMKYTISMHEALGRHVPKIAYDALRYYEGEEGENIG